MNYQLVRFSNYKSNSIFVSFSFGAKPGRFRYNETDVILGRSTTGNRLVEFGVDAVNLYRFS